jgi:hypothetical protein
VEGSRAPPPPPPPPFRRVGKVSHLVLQHAAPARRPTKENLLL